MLDHFECEERISLAEQCALGLEDFRSTYGKLAYFQGSQEEREAEREAVRACSLLCLHVLFATLSSISPIISLVLSCCGLTPRQYLSERLPRFLRAFEQLLVNNGGFYGKGKHLVGDELHWYRLPLLLSVVPSPPTLPR